MLPAHSDLRNYILTTHIPLTVPNEPRPGARTPPPSLQAQAAVAPRHAAAPTADRALDRKNYADALWGGTDDRAGAGGAGMVVAGEPRAWRPGEAMVFDTSFVHSAYRDPCGFYDAATPPRRRRDAAATPPRRRRDAAETPPRRRRDAAETPPRRRRDASIRRGRRYLDV